MKPRSRWMLPLYALLAFAALAPVANAAPAKPSGAGSLLYVQQMRGGSLRHVKGGGLELELTGVSPRVSTFTDRPERRAGTQRLRTFIGGWANSGFAADPPNAALVLDRAPSSRDVAMLTLSDPRYDRRNQTLTYRVDPLHAKDSTLASFTKRADPIHPGTFGSASLFVDNGASYGDTTYITFDITNGTTTSTTLKLRLSDAYWSLPDPPRPGGISINSTSLSLTGFYADSNELILTVPPGTSFSLSLDAPIQFGETETPTLTVEGVYAAAMSVSWETMVGFQSQVVTPGSPTPLTGISG
jgi:hypothetical protein